MFSTDETYISASAAPQGRGNEQTVIAQTNCERYEIACLATVDSNLSSISWSFNVPVAKHVFHASQKQEEEKEKKRRKKKKKRKKERKKNESNKNMKNEIKKRSSIHLPTLST